jgi:hypothetical protein
MDNRFEVAVTAGTMMSGSGAVARFPHRWTAGGAAVEAEYTGRQLLHLAAAGCVLMTSTTRRAGQGRPRVHR